MFDDNFLESLSADPVLALNSMATRFRNWNTEISRDEEILYYDEYIDAFYALAAYVEATSMRVEIPHLEGERMKNIANIQATFERVRTEYGPLAEQKIATAPIEASRERYRGKFGLRFTYEFSDSDLKRIQTLVNELRDFINRTEEIDAKHKARILAKLEALQREMHRTMSTVDKLWGLIGEAGVVLGKFGEDAKPFIAGVKEIALITWAAQAKAEGLPSSSRIPFLNTEARRIEESEDTL